jgi:hypothetical protein
MEHVVQQKVGHDTFMRAIETYVVVSVTPRSERPISKRFTGLDIEWNEIEDQLVERSDHFQDGKTLWVDLTFEQAT